MREPPGYRPAPPRTGHHMAYQALTSEAKSLFGNPWRFDQWNLTVQGQFVRRYGDAKAREFAVLAGTTFPGPKPRNGDEPQRDRLVYLVTRKILIEGDGSGIAGGRGYAGDGPPGEDV